MTRPALAVIALLTLAACGVDGAPQPPTASTTATATPGLTLSGSAEIGIARNGT